MNKINFGKRYNDIYKSGMQKSVWPWTDVVTILYKLKKYLDPNAKILEIGCGMGANIKLVESLGYEYYGIDISNYAINEILKLYPKLSGKLASGDFTKKLSFFDNKFDVILDRASLTCNTTSKIIDCIELVKKELISGGYFVGVDWYSTDHSGFKFGKSQEDKFSLFFDQKEPMFDPPTMHFSNKEHLDDLFCNFKIIHLQHNITEIFNSELSNPEYVASWSFVARSD